MRRFAMKVETLSGAGFNIKIDAHENEVWGLKSRIEKINVVPPHLQELYVASDIESKDHDDARINQSCAVVLCI